MLLYRSPNFRKALGELPSVEHAAGYQFRLGSFETPYHFLCLQFSSIASTMRSPAGPQVLLHCPPFTMWDLQSHNTRLLT